jgi:hypothetical protein
MADRWKDYAEVRAKNTGALTGENPEYKEDPLLKQHHALARKIARERGKEQSPNEPAKQKVVKRGKRLQKPGPAAPQTKE